MRRSSADEQPAPGAASEALPHSFKAPFQNPRAMDLDEWAHQYLVRNAKLKGWTFERDGDGYIVEARTRQRYAVAERLEPIAGADVIITLNDRDNLRRASELLNELGETRVVFANPRADCFWTLNPRMLTRFGDPERFRKKPAAYSSEVPIL